MGPDLELKGRLGSMASLDGKENEKSHGHPVAKDISCKSNYQDDIFKLEALMPKQAEQVKQVEESEVKITESTSEDETEISSSFGNALSGDKADEAQSDSEVMSELRDNGFDQECRMRKKSLTAHWKAFIQPLMWRCRWAELKMRRLMYQASKYDLQIEAIDRRKQLTWKNATVEDTCARCLPFSGSKQKGTIIKRRKRKWVEDSTGKAAYTAQIPLFSYPASMKRGADVAASLSDSANTGNPKRKRSELNFPSGCGDEPVSLEFRSDDNSLEQILWKIGVLQSDLGELKTRLKKVQDENAKDIYSADAMNTNAVRTSSAQNDVPTNEGRELVKVSSIASRHMPKSNMFMVKNETAISTHGKATNLIDITECNNQLQIAISGEKKGNGHLMYNSTAKELNNIEKVDSSAKELNNIEKVGVQSLEKPDTAKEEEQANIVPPVLVPLISNSDDQPETPMEAKQANIVPPVLMPLVSNSDNQPETPMEKEQANFLHPVLVPVIPTSDDQPETPMEEEQASIVPPVLMPVISKSDDQPETPMEEQANIEPSSPVPVISIANDQSTRSISGLTTSPPNTRSRGRGRGRSRRRGNRWSRRA
ncbi:uncharacterized protein LOC108215589 [Daucus carota subsp. sativus]|uniref:Uncharacterized protein n=1 Tax=Daucus carota subsp. sativus TaxID=79200 RepID=A0A162A6B7_DAUCS|nr:PREDICTED: uncharacterized protein LOC108215589 [Daucus carota subsp. sativus]